MNVFKIDLNTLEFNKVGSWPSSIKNVLILLTTALLLAFGTFFHIIPKIEYYHSKKEEQSNLEAAYEKYYEQIIHLPEYKQQLITVKKSLNEALEQFPESSSEADLLEELSQLAASAGLLFHFIKPLKEQTEDFYKSLPIELSLSGSYHSLGIFLSSVAKLQRIMTVHDFTLKSEPGKPALLSIQMLFQIYWGGF